MTGKEAVRLNDLKIFQLEDEVWYTAHNLMEFLNWYHAKIKPINSPEDLKELQMFLPEEGCMWSQDNITQEDIEALGEESELDRGGSGNLRRYGNAIYKLQNFADQMGSEIEEVPCRIMKKQTR